MRKRSLLLPVLVAALLTLTASLAHAGSFVLSLNDVTTGKSFNLTDNGVALDPVTGEMYGDFNGATDGIIFDGAVGIFNVTVYGNVLIPGGAGSPVQLNLSNFLVTSAQEGTFTATLTRTGLSGLLAGPEIRGVANYGATFFSNDSGGPTSGSVTFQSWINGQTVFNPQVTTSTDLNPGPPPPTAYSPWIAYGGGDLTLASMLTFEFDSTGSMQADTALRAENVPEPMTLLLFGPGVLGLAAVRRRLRSKAV